MDFNFDNAAFDRMRQQLGEQIRNVVNTTVRETADDDLDHATDVLHQRLNAMDGLQFDRAWSQNAVETLRRGDDLQINIS